MFILSETNSVLREHVTINFAFAQRPRTICLSLTSIERGSLIRGPTDCLGDLCKACGLRRARQGLEEYA